MDLKIFYNRYKVLEKIGEGGLGTIFLAEDLWSGREIALKLLSSDLASPVNIKLFQKEFKLLRHLIHPGLVEVYDLFVTEDQKFGYSMEFVPGKAFLENKKILDLKSFYNLAIQICQILDFIHSQRIIHCDLKPQNFLLSPGVKSKKVTSFGIKLMDFGLAVSQKPQEKKVKGTVGYIAPEVLKGESFDQRADLYSLGVIFYQALTGKLPFNHSDPALLIAAQLEQKPVAPDKINSKIPSDLSKLILKLLEINPNHRISKISQVQETLEKLSESAVKETFFFNYLESGQPLGLARPLRFLRQTLKARTPGLILLSGEKGMGKTAFLQQAKFLAQAKGFLAIEIKSDTKSSTVQSLSEPLQTIYNFLQEKYPRKLSEIEPEIKPILGKASDFGKKKPKINSSSTDSSDVIMALQKVSDLLPIVLLIDGLDYFDPESLRFLKTGPYQTSPGNFFIVATCSPEFLEDKSSVSSFLKRHLELEKAQLFTLQRLNPKQTAKFIATKLPSRKPSAEFSGYIYQYSNGNCFLILEIFRYFYDQKLLCRTDGNWQVELDKLSGTEIPPNLRKWLSQSLLKYKAEDLKVLKLASGLEDDFEMQALKFISDLSLENLFETLYRLLRDWLLLARKDAWGVKIKYQFANLGLKKILYESLPHKADLHLKIANFYEKQNFAQTPEGISILAFHYSQSGDYQKGFQFSQKAAGNLALEFAFPQALKHLEIALSLAQRFPEPEKVAKTAQALAQRAQVWKSMGELNFSLQDLKQILKLNLDSGLIRLKAETYKALTDLYRLKNSYPEAISYLNQALKIYQELGDEAEIAKNFNNLGNIFWMALDFQKSEAAFKKALEIQKKLGDPANLAITLNNIGSLYLSQNQYQKALDFYHQSLQLRKNLDNLEEKARTLNNIGVVNMALGKYQNAIVSLKESWELNKKTENKKEELFNLENLTESYYKTGNFFQALNYGEKGIKLAQEVDFPARLGRIQRLLGQTHLELADYTQALEFLEQGLKTATSIEDKELETWILLDLSQFYLILNQTEVCQNYLRQAYATLKQHPDPKSQAQTYLIEAGLALQEKNYKQSLIYLQEGFQLARKNNFTEDQITLKLGWGQLYLETKRFSEIENLTKEIETLLQQGDFGYFRPEFYLLKGSAFGGLEQKNLEKSEEFLKAGLAEAQKIQRKELIWRAHFYLGKTYFLQNDFENSYLEFEEAVEILKNITSGILNSDWKKSYLAESLKLELLKETKQIAQILIGKPHI
ncbi:MAG: hypothetical protein A2145_03275 [candidate division Zixibacteria bacterium RBG_16_40_9]|nr:MAG: hypothetical protein A2145_03275 [candidate division Zixibacteria bacterium RBG_16_40_9]